MNYIDAVYLKHAGRNMDTKVSIKMRNGEHVIHIRDFEFKEFKKALRFLQHVVETELH